MNNKFGYLLHDCDNQCQTREQLQLMENINRGFNWTKGTPSAINNGFWNTQNTCPLATTLNKKVDQK